MRSFRILDAAPLRKSSLLVLELEAPNPLGGVAPGMPAELVYRDGTRADVTVKSLGFASSTPEHAHLVVTAPPRLDAESLDRVEIAGG